MLDQGIAYEADLSIARFNAGVLSPELIGPLESTIFTAKPEGEIKERSSLRIGKSGKVRGSFGRSLATKIKLGVNAVDSRLLALIMLGSTAALSISGGSAVAENFTGKHDIWIKLANSNITAGTAAITGSVLNTDYKIDSELGAIMILSTGNLADGASLSVNYDFGAISGITIRAGTESKIDVNLIGQTVNRESGAKGRIRIPKVTLVLSNDLTLLADDYASAEFDGTCILVDGEDADFFLDENVVYS